MATGSIKRWFGERGYGFIVDDEGQDLSLPHSQQ